MCDCALQLIYNCDDMASFEKTKTGRWKAYVAIQGTRKSKTFDTKQAARDWAARQEYLIKNAGKIASRQPLRDVLDRYAREISIHNKGHKWEALRLAKIGRGSIGYLPISEVTPKELAIWRDDRLREVAPASVARELNLLSSVFTVARREWLLVDVNPVSDVKSPRKPPARNRIATQDELEALLKASGGDLSKQMARAIHAFLFARETAMRAGEIVGLEWDRVFIDRRFVHLPMTKNGHARDVPLTRRAIEMLEELPRMDPVFGLTSAKLDVLFRKARDKAEVKGLRFHDSRRMGVTQLSKKLEPLELAKVTGHRDLNMILNTYYAVSVTDISKKLD